MNKAKIKWDFWSTMTLVIMAIFALFLIYPLFSLFISGFQDAETGAFTLSNFARFFEKKYYYQSMINSFKVTVSVTFLAILIGAPIAYFMTCYKIKFKGLIEVLVIISMLSPPFIGAYSWILLGGRSGVITKFFLNTFGIELPSVYGFGGILLVFTLKLYPFIYLYVSGALKKIDVSLSEAAESLGCNSVKKVITIIIPLILPTVLAGALLVFMNALADFGTPMLIGEGFSVMPVIIYSEFISEVGGQANFAAAMASIMVLITALLFMAQKYVVNKKSFTMSSLRPIQPKEAKGIKGFLMHAFIYFAVFLSIIPQLTVIYTSFLKTKGSMFTSGFSLDSYRSVLKNAGKAIANSYIYGIIAIIIIILLGMFIAYLSTRRKNVFTSIIDTVTMFPYIVPGSVLGITLLLAFNKKPLLLSGTVIIMIVAFVIRRLPYTLRSSAAILYQISPSMEEASISLGYSPVRTFFKVTAIMMLPGVLSGALLSWITVINELSSSIILYTGNTRTMSVAIYTEVIRASYGTAAALSTILTVTTVISLLIFFKLSGSKDVNI
ncbi:ABC transporter permease [Cellulosilyticum lentocellum]|uniref:ABC-type transporter, integral membrane subunit n=1 Tax=Cellulosilyticum lentocellum (strain ATCC 49066 / DSM 5427 / NCIMB 11756 / RHM5) TaxID=642492 RepID=F2JLG3_CELLD|nr:iron ABC transporter permease [Cellulosilyticum lentocellum]ADZ82251.1 ABC-type transporter, integral membrane subunit [Cellulosilyticum lentocellum DSM 5427]